MQQHSASQVLLKAYLWLFLLLLILPLLVTAGAAFNDNRFPSVWPWRGLTDRWFVELWNDTRLISALLSTLLVAAGVAALAVPIGTAAAIFLNTVRGRSRTFLYSVMTAPILTPGAVIGLATLMLWNGVGVSAGLGITILGQVSVIAAYVMLLVLARLQSFDAGLEEAALDLGASHRQVLWYVLLPHLRPALLVGGILSFLQSMESYNVTLFTRGNQETLMIYIAAKVRTGISPSLNALAFGVLALSLIGAVLYEWLRRREERLQRQAERIAQQAALADEASAAHP